MQNGPFQIVKVKYSKYKYLKIVQFLSKYT